MYGTSRTNGASSVLSALPNGKTHAGFYNKGQIGFTDLLRILRTLKRLQNTVYEGTP